MSAAAKPLPAREPTYGQLRAQLAVYRAEMAAVRQCSPAVLIAAVRKIVAEADAACRGSADDAERLAALFSIRHVALDALFAVKVSERGPIGKNEPCVPRT